MTKYGDISPKTAAYVTREMLKRAMPSMVFDKFGKVNEPWPEEPDIDHDPLMICPGIGEDIAMCLGCTCREVHCESECGRSRFEQEAGCPDCEHIDQENYDETHRGHDMWKTATETIKFRRYNTEVFEEHAAISEEKFSHVHDALLYGTGYVKTKVPKI